MKVLRLDTEATLSLPGRALVSEVAERGFGETRRQRLDDGDDKGEFESSDCARTEPRGAVARCRDGGCDSRSGHARQSSFRAEKLN